MKVKAIFYYVLMIFLVLQPLLVACQPVPEIRSGCCRNKGCHQKEKQSIPVSKKCDDGIACNPFASCSQTQFVAVSAISFMETVAVNNKQVIIYQQKNARAGFITGCFHPPETIAL